MLNIYTLFQYVLIPSIFTFYVGGGMIKPPKYQCTKQAVKVKQHIDILDIAFELAVATCPRCGQVNDAIHSYVPPHMVRDLDVWNRQCYLRFRARQFECDGCEKNVCRTSGVAGERATPNAAHGKAHVRVGATHGRVGEGDYRDWDAIWAWAAGLYPKLSSV
jgi:hypothetical protein